MPASPALQAVGRAIIFCRLQLLPQHSPDVQAHGGHLVAAWASILVLLLTMKPEQAAYL